MMGEGSPADPHGSSIGIAPVGTQASSPASLSPSGTPSNRCFCWSLCTLERAEAWLREIPSEVRSVDDPWFGYLTAVYGPDLPLPFSLSRLSYFHHADDDWTASHPDVEWPMAPCRLLCGVRQSRQPDLQVKIERGRPYTHCLEPTAAAMQYPCPKDKCHRWMRRKDDPGRGSNASVAAMWLTLGTSLQPLRTKAHTIMMSS